LAQVQLTQGMDIDWGKTSRDYAKYRPGPCAGAQIRVNTLRTFSGHRLGPGIGRGILNNSGGHLESKNQKVYTGWVLC
jgi:hypothetical protein